MQYRLSPSTVHVRVGLQSSVTVHGPPTSEALAATGVQYVSVAVRRHALPGRQLVTTVRVHGPHTPPSCSGKPGSHAMPHTPPLHVAFPWFGMKHCALAHGS